MSKFGELISTSVPVLLDFYADWNEQSVTMHLVMKDVAAALALRTCTTQPALPPPAPLACVSSSQVDLQAASAQTISRRASQASRVWCWWSW